MSHHDQSFVKAPKMLRFELQDQLTPAAIQLLVKGQGTFTFQLKQTQPFGFILRNPNGLEAFRLLVTGERATFEEQTAGGRKEVAATTDPGSFLDPDPTGIYWLSIDCHNRQLRYGKGEMRLETMLLQYVIPGKEEPNDPYAWLYKLKELMVEFPVVEPLQIWRDPVTTKPAMLVTSTDKITMDDVALNRKTVAANLNATGQMLYYNVAGDSFELNTPEFLHFADAVEASIADERGWCYQKLAEKAREDEFGNKDELYLRITMGVNQGESPGIPYVMEIWPPGKSSPRHNHAGANAIIRVLHGEITVSLYSMLSTDPLHANPFATAVFTRGDITWISPQLNQNHRLENLAADGSTCITIQCYMYDESNLTHYEYFDYIGGDNLIHQFTPNSDADFLEFKAQMKKEWDDWYSKEHRYAMQRGNLEAVNLN